MVTICVVMAYCAWRIQAVNDLIHLQERVFSRMLHNQAEILNNQREMQDVLRKYR